jgi:hypothetical protein
VTRTDVVYPSAILMKVDLRITGCYKDLFLIWDTCWRYDTFPGGAESSGAIWGSVNKEYAGFNAFGTMYRTRAHIRLLSCEDGKWKVRGAKASVGYLRKWPWDAW